ncbi:MAG: DUF1016 family protein [Acholeplasmatales bacterium]|nr:DUF1016 family protein [Acholeplasmatales bacterium]
MVVVNSVMIMTYYEIGTDTIGLLLCREADYFVAKTSLRKNSIPLGISKYKFIDELQEYLNKKLNEIK